MAGYDIADTRPWTALNAITVGRFAVPVITSKAIAACVTPETTFDTWMMSTRGKRSATAYAGR